MAVTKSIALELERHSKWHSPPSVRLAHCCQAEKSFGGAAGKKVKDVLHRKDNNGGIITWPLGFARWWEKYKKKKIAPTDGPQQAELWEGHGLKQNHKAEDPTVLVPHGSKPKHLPRVGYLFRHTELRSELRITLNIKLHCPNIQLPEPVPTTLFLWQGLTV